MRLPSRLLISTANVLKDGEFIRFCTGLKMSLTPIDLLALYLLFRRHELGPYIDSLPLEIDCPLSWSHEDIQVCDKLFFQLKTKVLALIASLFNWPRFTMCKL